MNHSSRTYKSLKNSIVAFALYCINLLLGFYSRKVFIVHLGAEVLGLNTTATSLLQFLNLAELGIGTAIGCTLYKPLHDNDRQVINDIVSLQGWMYRKIAWTVIAGSILLMCFFPWIFNKMELPLWYAYASFSVMLFSALISYFVNYKQILLSANQQEYKINYSYKIVISIKILCQILAIEYLANGYTLWLILEGVFAILAALALNYQIQKTFPYLNTNLKHGKELQFTYPTVITKVKQLFFHKIGSFVLSQTSPIIIFAYSSLTIVSIYGNYMLIVVGLSMLLTAIFNGMNASVGNLVAEGDNESIMRIFRELFSSRFLIISTFAYGIYKLSGFFIPLWVGKEFMLDNFSLLLIILIFYFNTERGTVHSYINAYGLFADIGAPIIEAILNLGLSILLGYFWGLHGILLGVVISLFTIVFLWKPYYLFKYGLKSSFVKYVLIYAKHLLLFSITVIASEAIFQNIHINYPDNYQGFIIRSVITISIYGTILGVLLFFFEQGMRSFVFRLRKIAVNII